MSRQKCDSPQHPTTKDFELFGRAFGTHYGLSAYQPAKSIELLTEALELVAYQRLEKHMPRTEVEAQDLVTVLPDKTGIPPETLAGTRVQGDFEEALSAAVRGQEGAIRQVAAELRLIKAGLTPSHKPATVLLFAGLTGVGKTELANRIAKIYSSSRRPQLGRRHFDRQPNDQRQVHPGIGPMRGSGLFLDTRPARSSSEI